MRGIAILLVIAYHLGLMTGGYLGVDLFFVLSGFLITRLLLQESLLRGFYIRRIGRLAPALLITLFLAGLVAILNPAEGTWAGILGGLTYSSNFLLASGRDLGVLGHLWTLAVEEQFYALWPAALLLSVRWRGTRFAAMVAGSAIVIWILLRLALVACGASYLELDFAVHYDGLMMGALIALGPPRPVPTRFAGRLSRTSLCAFLIVAWFLPGNGVAVIEAVNIPLIGFVCALIIFDLPQRDPFFTLKPLTWIGKRSYGLYLFHALLLSIAMSLSSALALKLAAVAASFGLAALSLRFVEAPIRRAAREYAARLEARASMPRLGMPVSDHA